MTCLYVGLEAFEHALLEEYVRVFPVVPPEEADSEELLAAISRWYWFSQVKDDYNSTFFDAEEALDVESNHLKAWEVFLSRISGDRDHARFGRCKTLAAQNPKFPQCLQEDDIGTEPVCDIWPTDGKAWSILSKLFFDLISSDSRDQQTLNAPSDSPKTRDIPEHIVMSSDQDACGQDSQSNKSDCPDDTAASQIHVYEPYYEVWSLLRTCAGLRRSQNNRCKVVRFLKKGGFLDTHVRVHKTGQYVAKESLMQLCKSFSVGLSPNSTSVYDLPPTILSILQPIRPLNVLEMIPMEDLEIVSPQSGKLKLDTARYACWRKENMCRFDHHLFTEEEVFRYCVTANWTFPDHLQDERVLFRLTPLGQSDLLHDLTSFWEKWNDIAITQDSDSRQWIVLETVPGIKFRAFLKQNNRFTALEYFRTLANDANDASKESLQTAIGLDFQPRFENLLKLISCEQIVHVDPSPMRGAHGAVYRASWARPASIGVADAEIREVALKTVRAADGLDQNRIFRELDLTFNATLGQTSGNINFWGVVQTPSATHRPVQSVSDALPPGVTFLVFDFAKHGSLLSHLRKSMTGSFLDWGPIFWIVAVAAEGLSNLHKAGIVHRDLHLENILVTERETPSDGITDADLSVKIADFGEGKMIHLPNQAAAPSLRSAGNTFMRPPEVRKYEDYTAKSDVFDFGRLLEELVVLQWRRAEEMHGGERHERLPLWLFEAIQQCLEMNPDDRITSEALSRKINALENDAIDKRQDGPFELVDPEQSTPQRPERTALADVEDDIPRG